MGVNRGGARGGEVQGEEYTRTIHISDITHVGTRYGTVRSKLPFKSLRMHQTTTLLHTSHD